jgi:NAD(P)-dependent dehydrogenase (short-subunit alcohol dehydrogenase family)
MSSTEANMAGKVCLVTGASRGIGKGIATMLSKAGAIVYVTGKTNSYSIHNYLILTTATMSDFNSLVD